MNAKEKAKELFNKYAFVEIANYTSKFEIKQCALIAVDELIDSIEIGFEDYKSLAKNSYWLQVKQEINEL